MGQPPVKYRSSIGQADLALFARWFRPPSWPCRQFPRTGLPSPGPFVLWTLGPLSKGSILPPKPPPSWRTSAMPSAFCRRADGHPIPNRIEQPQCPSVKVAANSELISAGILCRRSPRQHPGQFERPPDSA